MSADRDALEAAERSFNEAMMSNDVARIAECITSDWVLVTPERGPVAGAQILAAIESGALTHDWMVKSSRHIHQMGDIATVTGRGRNTGAFRGEPIAADEWVTDVYHRLDGRWRCVLTHLTPAAESA